MKILLAGNWQWPIYEKSSAEALHELGVQVIPFSWKEFFYGTFGRVQRSIPFPGPAVFGLNSKLIQKVDEIRPDVLWIWRGTHILPSTLEKIKKKFGTKLISYNNDDPFGPKAHGNAPWHHYFLWRMYIKTLPCFDYNFVYRQLNIEEAKECGAKNPHVLMPYFVPSMHRPVELNEEDKKKYECDVVFVGHYEADGRVDYLRALVDAGVHVKLFGGGAWNRDVLGNLADYFGDTSPAQGEEYCKALCGAKMCLAFLSKLNRDTYTRRCFEIPACGQLLICEKTDDLARIFKEDEEAVFFLDKNELVQKALFYLRNEILLKKIANDGSIKVKCGYKVKDVMNKFINTIL